MLPGVGKDQEKQNPQRGAELFHLAIALRVFHLDQARIVDRFGEVDFRRTGPKRPPTRRHRVAPTAAAAIMPPPRTCSRPVIGICMAKISCSSCSSAIFCSPPFLGPFHRDGPVLNQRSRVHSRTLNMDSYHGTRPLSRPSGPHFASSPQRTVVLIRDSLLRLPPT